MNENGDILKPCPFCGQQVRETAGHLGTARAIMFYECKNRLCGAIISFNNAATHLKLDAAREYYNARAK